MNHGGCREGDRKGSCETAGRVDLVELYRRLTERIGERKQGPGLWVPAVVRAKSDGFVGAGLPFADRGEVHRHFVAGGSLVERQQVPPVAEDTDESAVLEWTGRVIRADERRIDRNRVGEAAV